MAEARTALGLDDRDPWAHLAHGVALFRVRRYGEAERALRRALEFNPNLALAHAYLAWPLAIRGAHEEALKSAEHALRLSPNDPLVGAQASYSIAITHFAAGRYLNCVVSARETTERYPEYIPGHYTLAAAAALSGGVQTAAKSISALLRLRPDCSVAWMSAAIPWPAEIGERLAEGWRIAGMPEE